MRHWINQIFFTKLGWLLICTILAVFFGVLANWYNWALIGMIISFIYPVVLTLVMIVYAWIINPLRDRKNKK